MSNKKITAIIGSGPCGLYAAHTLSHKRYPTIILDKEKTPGGLARGHYLGNNFYDMGVHMFHAFDKEIFEAVKKAMGNERIEVDLQANIKWGNMTYQYPLQFKDMIKEIPLYQLSRQISALLWTQVKNFIKTSHPINAEEALIQLYGKPLYRFFFEDFTHRYWELHPKEMSASFITSKMPKLSAVDVIKRGLEKLGIHSKAQSTQSALRKETLHYSSTGSEAMPRCLGAAISNNGGILIQEAEINTIMLQKNRVIGVQYKKNNEEQKLNCNFCISTMPMNQLIQSISPTPPKNIMVAAQQLTYKPIVIYGLLVKKRKCLQGLYTYYRNRIFHRVGEPKNAGLKVNPPDSTILIVEMTCEIGDEKWNGSIKQKVFEELAEENICREEDIAELHIIKSETGYPVFSLGFEKNLEIVQNYLAEITNFVSTGRQGGFTYPNMHEAMRMGWHAANKAMDYNHAYFD